MACSDRASIAEHGAMQSRPPSPRVYTSIRAIPNGGAGRECRARYISIRGLLARRGARSRNAQSQFPAQRCRVIDLSLSRHARCAQRPHPQRAL
jgi:hypothetical protein